MATINVRNKGKRGEQDVARDLNLVLYMLYQDMKIPNPASALDRVQRNQNQTAVGGCDLVGTFDLAIEVKRQEQLNINTWWAQCVESARRLDQIPVLIFRQNNEKWRVMLPLIATLPPAAWNNSVGASMELRAELDYESFKKYFRERAMRLLYDEYARKHAESANAAK